MKRLFTKFLSSILILALLLSITPVGASAFNDSTPVGTFSYEDIPVSLTAEEEAQIARDAYYGLSPKAKLIFNQMLTIDPNTRSYHINNIDGSFIANNSFSAYLAEIHTTAATSSAGTLTTIVYQLNALNLPTSVVYSLEAVAAGIIAALADGPLPFGDILLLVATAGAVIVIAANWSAISTKWNAIVTIFINAFSSIATAIVDTFAEISAEVPTVLAIPTISYSGGKTATVGGVVYNCQVAISDLTLQQKQQTKYYIGILAYGDVYVDVTKPITTGIARGIIALNHGVVGVVGTTQTYARGLAGTDPIGPEISGNGAPGYYWHYHKRFYLNCHIWYPTV
ncbi:MAG: hypothetical protein LBH17_00095 [Oscillospiraceae bacterium]|jgi:hypothetical protein|nr:hypothetical protein [Oscillospiraceae bacterium]